MTKFRKTICIFCNIILPKGTSNKHVWDNHPDYPTCQATRVLWDWVDYLEWMESKNESDKS